MTEFLPWRAELIERIRWMVQLRWLAVVGGFVVIIIADWRLPGVLPLVQLFGLVVFVAVYNVFFYVYAYEIRTWLDQGAKLRVATTLVHAQILLDLGCLTLLLHYSGGAESPFATYYVLHIVLACIILSRLASFMYAGLAVVMYSAMLLLEYNQAVAHIHLVSIVDPDLYRRETYLTAAVFALATTLFFSVYIASSITGRLRRRESELNDARLALEARGVELTEANEQLQELDRTKTRFMWTVTHELRAPVAAIQGYLDLILNGYVAADKLQEILQRSRQRTAGLLDLIAELLQLARIRDMNMRQVGAQPVDLTAAMQETLELFRGGAEEKKLIIETDVHTKRPAMVAAAQDHIKIIWTNLISNAIKYTPAGGHVTITIAEDAQDIEGRVQDSGIGIPPECLPHIFEEFYRTDEAKVMTGCGTGLGLSITRRLVELYGGHIEAHSQPGKGSTFSFRLPRLVPEAGPGSETAPGPDTQPRSPVEADAEEGKEIPKTKRQNRKSSRNRTA